VCACVKEREMMMMMKENSDEDWKPQNKNEITEGVETPKSIEGTPVQQIDTTTTTTMMMATRTFEINEKVMAKASFDSCLHPATVIEVQQRTLRRMMTQTQTQTQTQNTVGECDGQRLPTTIATTRTTNRTTDSTSTVSNTISKYYIHYEKFDKRLDEWVDAENVYEFIEGVQFDQQAQTNQINSTNEFNRTGDTTNGSTGDRKLTRTMKRRYNEIHNVDGVSVEDLPKIDQLAEKAHEEKTKMKNIRCVRFGKFEMDAWYYSPYPEIYGQCDTLHVCPFCLKYMRKEKTMVKHKKECSMKHPPGKMIYEHKRLESSEPTICFWEIDGKNFKTYCQNLCLVAKLFLDHKTLYYDVEPFNFYVMTECAVGEHNHIPVGYFSKEKESAEEYNLACILTIPSHQRRGYGSFLIGMSYELSKREGKFGTPERPLSDLGRVSYRSYWSKRILEVMRGHKNMNGLTVRDLSLKTMFRESDVTSALQSLNLLKYWKGQHIVSATPKIVETHLLSFSKTTATNRSKSLRFNSELVKWNPPEETMNGKKK
jgi:histone acetyltransferase MYST1